MKPLARLSWRLFYSTIVEALPYIGLTFLILTTLVFVQQLGRYSQVVLSFQASTEATLTFLLSMLPGIIVITLPVAMVLGTVITCSRQSADNELTVAQACGIDQRALGLPFLALGVVGTLLSIYLTTEVAPGALRQLKSLRSRILLQEATLQIKPHLFVTTFPNLLLYVQDVDERTGDWLGVFILQNDEQNGQTRVVTAERGRLRINNQTRLSLEAELLHGISYETSAPLTGPVASQLQGGSKQGTPGSKIPAKIPAKIPEDIESASEFQKASIKLTNRMTPEGDGVVDVPGGLAEMTLTQLDRQSRIGSPAERLKARVEWHKRLAFPFACLTLTYITFLVALRGRRFSTRPRTVVAILFVALAYYLILVAGQNLAASGALPPWIAVWLSNILLGGYILLATFSNHKFDRIVPEAFSERFLNILTWLRSRSKTAEVNSARSQRQPIFSEQLRSIRFSLVNLINYMIISEIAKYFLLALLALVITSITFTLFDLIPAISKSDATAAYAASYLAYLAPQLAYYVAPFAIVVAILAGCSVLARTNQFVVLSAAGQGRNRIALAVLATVMVLGTGLWILSELVLPVTNREQDLRYHRIKNKQLEQTTIAFGRKWVFGMNQTIYSFQRIEADHSLVNVAAYRLTSDQGLLAGSTFFNRAIQVDGTAWQILEGHTEAIRPDLTIERRLIGGASPTDQIIIEDGPAIFKRTVNESTKMSSDDLREYIARLAEIGITSIEMELDLQKRYAFPFSCLTLGILAIPFATTRRARQSSPIVSVAIGVAISLVLWLLMTVFEAAGKQASLPVTVAIWGPQVLFLAIGVFLNARESRM